MYRCDAADIQVARNRAKHFNMCPTNNEYDLNLAEKRAIENLQLAGWIKEVNPYDRGWMWKHPELAPSPIWFWEAWAKQVNSKPT